ncbi:hypothetical protein [Bradyrhizobium sp. I71]|uniref:hypothetical protein n=1 Tax=Bradyrhizobium sp. I71 TaxID=2590772 RepID=UPI001EF780C0|nr:hypothetical protein [Bradyrhizobium sp. I71]
MAKIIVARALQTRGRFVRGHRDVVSSHIPPRACRTKMIRCIEVTVAGEKVDINHWLVEQGFAYPTFYPR